MAWEEWENRKSDPSIKLEDKPKSPRWIIGINLWCGVLFYALIKVSYGLEFGAIPAILLCAGGYLLSHSIVSPLCKKYPNKGQRVIIAISLLFIYPIVFVFGGAIVLSLAH